MQEKYGFKLIHFSSSEVYGDYDDIMYEDVMDKHPIKQMNDYAMSKWVNEMQIRNSQILNNTQTVIVRLFNTYGPGEYYSSYRSVICLFCYRALHDIPYTVFTDHLRTSTYIEDAVIMLANITDNFKPGEVYNIASNQYHDIKTASDIILGCIGKKDNLVTYKKSEPLTTKVKKVDVTKALQDLKHTPNVKLEDGIQKTIDWMRDVYNVK